MKESQYYKILRFLSEHGFAEVIDISHLVNRYPQSMFSREQELALLKYMHQNKHLDYINSTPQGHNELLKIQGFITPDGLKYLFDYKISRRNLVSFWIVVASTIITLSIAFFAAWSSWLTYQNALSETQYKEQIKTLREEVRTLKSGLEKQLTEPTLPKVPHHK
jgi:hypothetical protein